MGLGGEVGVGGMGLGGEVGVGGMGLGGEIGIKMEFCHPVRPSAPSPLLRLEELQEKIVLELAGEKVTPMVANPGRILLTSHRLYFQPFNNAEVVSMCGWLCCCLQCRRACLLMSTVHSKLCVQCNSCLSSIRRNLF